MKLNLRILSVLYALGALLHLADILIFRLVFSEMDIIWQSWIIFLFIGDSVAAFGLWKRVKYGITVSIYLVLKYFSNNEN